MAFFNTVYHMVPVYTDCLAGVSDMQFAAGPERVYFKYRAMQLRRDTTRLFATALQKESDRYKESFFFINKALLLSVGNHTPSHVKPVNRNLHGHFNSLMFTKEISNFTWEKNSLLSITLIITL